MKLQELTESLTPRSYRPTEHERVVVALVVISQTPQLAYDQIRNGLKLNAAADRLNKLGILSIIDGEATLTQAGTEFAEAQAIIDGTGQPTDEATRIAASTV